MNSKLKLFLISCFIVLISIGVYFTQIDSQADSENIHYLTKGIQLVDSEGVEVDLANFSGDRITIKVTADEGEIIPGKKYQIQLPEGLQAESTEGELIAGETVVGLFHVSKNGDIEVEFNEGFTSIPVQFDVPVQRQGMQLFQTNGGLDSLEDSSLTIEISKITNLLGQEFSEENPFDPNGEFKLHVDWKLEDNHGYEEGSQVTFTLPEELHFNSEINLELKDPNNDVVANVYINSNNEVTMTFTDFVKNASDVKGQFDIIAKLDKSKTEENEGNIIIGPIGEEGSLTLPISMLDREKDVQKQGHPERQYEAGYIDWEVTVNAGRVFLENASITDVLPEGVEYVQDSLKVYKQKVSVNNEVLGEEEVTGLNVSTDNGEISVEFGDINHQYVVRYQTKITDEDKKSFVNEVMFETKNEPPKEADATVHITRGEPLTKQAVPNSFDPKTGIIEWEIEFNYNKKSLNNETLTDTWTVTPARNMTLVEGEVTFTEMNIDENGVATPTGNVGLPAGATLNPTANGFEVTNITTDKPYKVTYKTQIEGRITDTINVENTAGFGPHEVTGTGPGELGRYYGTKSAGTINYATKTIDWTIQLNHDEYPMGNIVIEDTLGAGLTLVENSLAVNGQDENGQPAPMPVLSKNGQNFTLTFPTNFVTEKMVTITYKTTFNPNEVPNYEPENSAVVKWTPGAEGSQQTGNISAKTKFRPEVENYHWKNAYYDPATKEITWEMIVNYRENSFANLRIEDELQGEEILEPYDFTVEELNIAENGDYTVGESVSGYDLEITGKSFELTLGKTNKAYKITYKTSLAGLENITKEYKNEANVFDGNEKINEEPLTASAGIYEEQKYADKSGNQENNSKFADWQIFVNIAQEKITDLKLTDTASRNQEYIEDTIKVYGVKYEDGKPVKDPGKELDPDKYTVTIGEFDYDNPNSNPSFVLEWHNDVEVTYVVEYSTLFFAGHGESIENTYKLEGNNKTLSDADTAKGDSLVIRQTASGSASGKSGRLIIQKTDSTYDFTTRDKVTELGDVIKDGIEFELYDVNSDRLVKKGKTNENGFLDFGRLLYGNYKLIEKNVPEGYIAPDNNKIITINKEYSSALEDHTVEIENYEAIFAVELTKLDDVDGEKLAEAEFAIYATRNDAVNDANRIMTETTDTDGYLVFNLADAQPSKKEAGMYYVKEITPPQFYEANDTIYTVTIGDKERTPVKVNNNGEIKNALIKGKGELRKIDAERSAEGSVVGLQGATFVVKDRDGKIVDRFMTDTDGIGVTTKGLRPGSYTVEEESAPSGFEKSNDTFHLEIPKAESEETYPITAEGETERVDVKNTVKTTNIAITKENSAQRGNKIAGVTFAITAYNGTAYDGRYNDIADGFIGATAVTQSNGVATFENLPPGAYTIVESEVPTEYGFIPDSTPFTMTINYNQVDNKTTVSTTRTNKPLAKVTLRKVDSESNFRLQGVQFSLWKGETRITNHFGMKDAVYTINSSGEIVITGLTPGNYELREVAAPNGYTKETNHSRTFTVPAVGQLSNANVTEEINFTNFEDKQNGAVGNKIVKGSVELTKLDGDDGTFLDGVTFELKATELYNVPSANYAQFLADYNNQLQPSYTTANGGKIEIGNLRPGKYTFTETQTITGYQPHTWGQPITFEIPVSSNQVKQEVTVENYKLVDIGVEKTWIDTGYDRPTEIEVVLKRNGTQIKTAKLNEGNNWSHTFEQQLAVDENGEKYTYTVDELNVPNGYAKTIEGDVENGFTITNEALKTKIELTKTDSRTDAPLENATVDIRLKDTTDVIATETTDKNGKLSFENLQPGVYELVETVAPAGYYKLTGPIEVTVERSDVASRTTIYATAQNNPYADVTLTKVDAETFVPLTGAEFTIYDENDSVVLANIPVNNSGELRVTGLPQGSYVLKETKAPTGYTLNDTSIPFTVDPDQDTEEFQLGNFTNAIERGSVSFTKKDDSGEPMAGVSFTITSTFLVNATEMFSATVETDDDGKFYIDGLRPGTYKITEDVPTGYQYIGGDITFDLKLDASNKNIVLDDVINYKKVAIDVEKVWQDDDNATNARPSNIEVQLFQGDKEIGTPVTLNDTNDWKHTFTDLDAVDENGDYYEYTVDEVEVPTGYSKAITGNMTDGFTIINTRSENITISGEKTWVYGTGGEQYTPDEITVTLMKNNDTEVTSQKVGAPWTYEFTNLPRFDDNGVEIDYSIAEADVAGFTSNVSGYNITNTQETTEVTVTKNWEEVDAQFRPKTITVQVKNGDTVVASHDLNSDETTYTFTNLPKYDKNGNEITYTVDEVTPTGYEKTVSGNEITNTQIVTEVPVTKEWIEEDARFRPANVTIQLKIGNDVYRTHTLSGDAEATEWSYTFENLPAFDENGAAIAYTVDEIVPTGYTKSINGTEITNTQTTENIEVTKVWSEVNPNYRPDQITIELKIGDKVYRTHTLQGDTTTPTWTYTFENVPTHDADGNKITYTIDEVTPTGYVKSINGTEITNTQETISISGTKTWQDEDPSTRPETITIQVMKGTDVIDEQTLTVSTTATQTYTFENLPKYDEAGNEITYTIHELPVPGYKTVIDGNDITNTRADKVDVIGTKTWKDDNDAKGDRPTEITVQLFANGIEKATTTATSPDWTYSFTDLDGFDEHGVAITYTVKEVPVPGYKTEINGYDITNIRTGTTTIEGTKTWLDDDAEERPDTLAIHVYRAIDGEEGTFVETRTIQTNDTSNWTYNFTYPAFDEVGRAYTYTVEEIVPAGYELAEQDGYNFTNVRVGETEVTVTKTWLDDDNATGDRPTAIEVTLYANGEAVETADIQADENWTYTFTQLPKYDAEGKTIVYTIDETTQDGYEKAINGFEITNTRTGETEFTITKTWQDETNTSARPDFIKVNVLQNGKVYDTYEITADNDWELTIKNIPRFDEQGVAYEYTITEHDVPGYDASVDGYNITNTRAEEKSFTITKNWLDNKAPDRPTTIKVDLYRAVVGGVAELVGIYDVTADNDWQLVMTNLPTFDEKGQPYTYEITEHAVPGYETTIHGFDITNLRIGETSVNVTKTWLDDDNATGARPNEITITLLQNGQPIDHTSLTAETDWTFTFAQLAKYDENGVQYVYTIEEAEVTGYESTIVKTETGYQVTNVRAEAMALSGQKTWVEVDNRYRPEAIIVSLMADDLCVAYVTVTAGTNWTYTFSDVPRFDEAGKEITYAIAEHPVHGYDTEVLANGDIVNTQITTTITGTKTWIDNNAPTRPSVIQIDLLKDEEVVQTIAVTADTNWTYTFENVVKYDSNGEEITYTVCEHTVEGYESEVNGYDITNRLEETKGTGDEKDPEEKPNNEKEPEKDANVDSTGKQPPKTATNMYNLLAIGLGVVTIGIVSIFAGRRRKKSN